MGIITIIISPAVLPDVNMVVDLISVTNFLEAYIRFSSTVLSRGLVNMFHLDRRFAWRIILWQLMSSSWQVLISWHSLA